MMKFLLQTIDGRVTLDFVFTLERAIEYQQWRGEDVSAVYCELDELDKMNFGVDCDEIRDYVPVGTVEFVMKFCELFINEQTRDIIKPLNVPDELLCYRMPTVNVVIGDNEDARKKLPFDSDMYFIKSNDVIKSEDNGLYRDFEIPNLPKGNYQISKYDDNITSEWRCFVYNGELQGIQYYNGDFTEFPSITAINSMIADYKSAPVAYTLDVYVSGDIPKTFVMECHEFWSCGLYGFSDYQRLPFMFYRTFNNIKKKLTKNE